MADTMATPCSEWLLLIVRRNGLKRQNCSDMNDIWVPIVTSSNRAKSLTPRRHLVRDQEAGGSNPLAPTNQINNLQGFVSRGLSVHFQSPGLKPGDQF